MLISHRSPSPTASDRRITRHSSSGARVLSGEREVNDRHAREAAAGLAERHDNIEAIYKKLEERRDLSDVTDLMKELHRIVNEAIRSAAPGEDQTESSLYDLSHIDLEKLRDEFAKKVRRKAFTLQDVRKIVEDQFARMLAQNPVRMDYYRKYSEIVADYNREKDRVTIEQASFIGVYRRSSVANSVHGGPTKILKPRRKHFCLLPFAF